MNQPPPLVPIPSSTPYLGMNPFAWMPQPQLQPFFFNAPTVSQITTQSPNLWGAPWQLQSPPVAMPMYVPAPDPLWLGGASHGHGAPHQTVSQIASQILT